MSTQSGISVSEELASAFTAAQTDDSLRVLVVVIDSERLVPSATLPAKGSASDDFDSIPSFLSEKHAASPAYLLVKLDDDNGSGTGEGASFCLCTWVPDASTVRQKMLFSSTKATLSRQLGDAKFVHSIHASVPDELSSEGYRRFLKHQSSSAPLTAREQEMADIKAAEGLTAQMQGSSVRRSHTASSSTADGSASSNTTAGGAQVGMKWREGVEEAVRGLVEGDTVVVQLGIDTKAEEVELLDSSKETSGLKVRDGEPSYTFYKHATGVVFIYCCPSGSPIRGRMIYSSNAQTIVQDVKKHGVEVIKKLETSTPSEITPEYMNAECAPPKEDNSNAPAAQTGFARPPRPGGRRR